MFSIETFQVDEGIKKIALELCGSEATARSRFKKSWTDPTTRPDWGWWRFLHFYNTVPEAKEFADESEKNIERTLDKTLITVTASIDKDLLKTAKKAHAAIEKKKEEIRQEKKNHKSSES